MGYTRRNGVGLRQNPMSPAAPGTAPGKAEPLRLTGLSSSSPGRIRTYDPPVNSRMEADHSPNIGKEFGQLPEGYVPPDVPAAAIDPDLAAVVRTWSILPPSIRAAIRALVQTAEAN
jgi:hypothetical protein